MSKILEILIGLPGSGKSTYAREQVENSSGKVKCVNKDSLRDMFDAGRFSKHREKEIIKARDILIIQALNDPEVVRVIVDDTNLTVKGRGLLHALAEMWNGDGGVQVFENSEFLHVPKAECIKRDLARANSVGVRIIDKMYYDHVYPIHTVSVFAPPGAQRAIIVDIDGTLADHNGRSPYDYDSCYADVVIEEVADMVDRIANRDTGIRKIIMSGRPDSHLAMTVDWLDRNDIDFHDLHMRREGDDRPDHIIKHELYTRYISGVYNVIGVFDDRNSVVDMWRRIGFTVFQVADGNF